MNKVLPVVVLLSILVTSFSAQIQTVVANPAKVQKKLSNPNATKEAKALHSYLVDMYGKKQITGQCDDKYLQRIKDASGKEPAIMGYDFDGICPSQSKGNKDVDKAIKWVNERGGIAQFQWHWISPNADGDYYSGAFKLGDALKDKNSSSYKNMMRDIDLAAAQLKRLQDANIPVIWRPLHEAEGKWFWWGMSGAGPCKELYRLMYDRFTNHHKLNNLIWNWTSYGTDKENFYPGDDVVDIISFDYENNNSWTGYEKLFSNGGKIWALGEEGKLTDPANFQKRPWSYYMTWAYMIEDPSKKDGKNTSDWIKKVYNDPISVTLSDLPKLKEYPFPGNDSGGSTPNVSPIPTKAPVSEGNNIALSKTATASSDEATDKGAGNAVDGDETTRWASSASDEESISVDLGKLTNIDKVVLKWEDAYGTAYKIQVSKDGTAWEDVFSTTSGKGGTEEVKFEATLAKFVKMQGAKRASEYGFSLFEFEVFESKDAPATTPTPTKPTDKPQTTKVWGDLNGDSQIDSTDYVLLKRWINGKNTDLLGEEGKKLADVNGDAKLDSNDLVLIKRKIIGVIKKFPAEDAVGTTPTATPTVVATQTPVAATQTPVAATTIPVSSPTSSGEKNSVTAEWLRKKLSQLAGGEAVEIDGKKVTLTDRQSDQNRKYARTLLKQFYKECGYEVTEHDYGNGGVNLIAEKKGQDDQFVVLGAHYDTVDCAGADDNGSGTIGILGAAYELASYPTLKHGIRFVSFDQEEIGLVGSGKYVEKLKKDGQDKKLIGAICPDGIMYDTNDDGEFLLADLGGLGEKGNKVLSDAIQETIKDTGLKLKSMSNNNPYPGSDMGSFWEAGLVAVDIGTSWNDNTPHYHQKSDTVDKGNFNYMMKLTKLMTGAAAKLASK
jgi:hypothetical protein